MTLKYTNRSDFPPGLVLDIYEHARKALNVNADAVRVLRVYRHKHNWRGSAYRAKQQIIVRVAMTGAGFPRRHVYPGRRDAPAFVLRDCYDALSYVLFHELAHFKDYQLGNPQDRQREQRVERMHKPHFEAFQTDRAKLFHRWGHVPKPEFYLGCSLDGTRHIIDELKKSGASLLTSV